MGPTWGLSAPGGPHVDLMNFVIGVDIFSYPYLTFDAGLVKLFVDKIGLCGNCYFMNNPILFSNSRMVEYSTSWSLAQPHIQQRSLDVYEERFGRHWPIVLSHSEEAALHVPCWQRSVCWWCHCKHPGRTTWLRVHYLSGRVHVGSTNGVLLQCWW